MFPIPFLSRHCTKGHTSLFEKWKDNHYDLICTSHESWPNNNYIDMINHKARSAILTFFACNAYFFAEVVNFLASNASVVFGVGKHAHFDVTWAARVVVNLQLDEDVAIFPHLAIKLKAAVMSCQILQQVLESCTSAAVAPSLFGGQALFFGTWKR